jgi:hypothetical protein
VVKCYNEEAYVIMWDELLLCGTNGYYVGQNVTMWDQMLSSGANVIMWSKFDHMDAYVIMWDELLSSGTKFYHAGSYVII